MKSSLDRLLAETMAEGKYDSSGQFTLATERALEKLASFQLPGPASWVTKVIQASVASGCQELHIQQRPTSTDFRWVGPPNWSENLLEAALFDPENSPAPGLQHFKQAFWSVALHGKRPFYLLLPGWSRALFWDGQSLSRKDVFDRPEVHLQVSHRSLQQSGGLFSFLEVMGARCNAEVLLEARTRAFSCPIPLSLDSRRLDTLQSCPNQGLHPTSYPVVLQFLEADLPTLKLPPATRSESEVPANTHRLLLGQLGPELQYPESFQIAAWLSLHAHRFQQWDVDEWQTTRQKSHIYWILDGVLSDARSFDFPERCCSLALVCSAEGLTTDMGGLALRMDDKYERRLEAICRAVDPFLSSADVCFDELLLEARRPKPLVAAAQALSGVCLSLFQPVRGLGLVVNSIYSMLGTDREERALVTEFYESLNQLRNDWEVNRSRRPS